jgi:hypothetical protein
MWVLLCRSFRAGGMAHKGISLGSRIVEQKRPKPIGNQSWKVALRPVTAGKSSNPASGKYSFMFVCVSAPDDSG